MTPETPLAPAVGAGIPPEAPAYIRALAARVVVLAAIVGHLEATVQQRQEHVPQTSRPSARPPSSDPPQGLGQRPPCA
jgi:hypothetical protein